MQELVMCLALVALLSVIYMVQDHQSTIEKLTKKRFGKKESKDPHKKRKIEGPELHESQFRAVNIKVPKEELEKYRHKVHKYEEEKLPSVSVTSNSNIPKELIHMPDDAPSTNRNIGLFPKFDSHPLHSQPKQITSSSQPPPDFNPPQAVFIPTPNIQTNKSVFDNIYKHNQSTSDYPKLTQEKEKIDFNPNPFSGFVPKLEKGHVSSEFDKIANQPYPGDSYALPKTGFVPKLETGRAHSEFDKIASQSYPDDSSDLTKTGFVPKLETGRAPSEFDKIVSQSYPADSSDLPKSGFVPKLDKGHASSEFDKIANQSYPVDSSALPKIGFAPTTNQSSGFMSMGNPNTGFAPKIEPITGFAPKIDTNTGFTPKIDTNAGTIPTIEQKISESVFNQVYSQADTSDKEEDSERRDRKKNKIQLNKEKRELRSRKSKRKRRDDQLEEKVEMARNSINQVFARESSETKEIPNTKQDERPNTTPPTGLFSLFPTTTSGRPQTSLFSNEDQKNPPNLFPNSNINQNPFQTRNSGVSGLFSQPAPSNSNEMPSISLFSKTISQETQPEGTSLFKNIAYRPPNQSIFPKEDQPFPGNNSFSNLNK